MHASDARWNVERSAEWLCRVWLACVLATAGVSPAFAAGKEKSTAGARSAETRPVLRAGNPVAGRDKADAERCVECHGVEGHGSGEGVGSEGKFPKLAGQYPDYIIKQIRDFRSGARKHDIMTFMARSVADADLVDIAAYFGSQRRMSGEGRPRVPQAPRLYHEGDAARGIPACVSCHFEQRAPAAGNVVAPIIAGQQWRYFDKQMRDWKSGDRRNSEGEVMNRIAGQLSEDEIVELADYISAQ